MPGILEKLGIVKSQLDELEKEMESGQTQPQVVEVRQTPAQAEVNVNVRTEQQAPGTAPEGVQSASVEEGAMEAVNNPAKPVVSPVASPIGSTEGNSSIKSRLQYWENASDDAIREGLKDGTVEKFILEYQGVPLTGMQNIKDSLQKVV